MESYRSDGFTCWSLIEGAAAGDERERSKFSTRYLPMLRTCFERRRRGSALEESGGRRASLVDTAEPRRDGPLADGEGSCYLKEGPTTGRLQLEFGFLAEFFPREHRRW